MRSILVVMSVWAVACGGPSAAKTPPEPPEQTTQPTLPSKHVAGPSDDADGDRIVNANDRCPNRPEDIDGFEDADGCPDNDNDGDGIVDESDKCPNKPERVNGHMDDDGCPDHPPRVVIRPVPHSPRVEKLYFPTSGHVLSPQAMKVIDVIAKIMADHPEILLVEVMGHADVQETNAARVSQQRAVSVRQALISRGVDGKRLRAVGYGTRQPIATNQTAQGRAKNRRVELKVIKKRP